MGMEHANDRNHHRNLVSWASQPAAAPDAYAQAVDMDLDLDLDFGPADDLLNTEARQNPQSLIQYVASPPTDTPNTETC